MKVLWFSITPARYGEYSSRGGGWIESLQRVVSSVTDIELGISFINPTKPESYSVKQNNVTYYPIYIERSFMQKWLDRYTYTDIDNYTIGRCLDVIRDFQPDLIHIFGSEWCFGLLYKYVNIPIVIHMQGCWPIYWDITKQLLVEDAYFFKKHILKPRRLLTYYLNKHQFEERVVREEEILSHTMSFMGRTSWDKALTKLYSPDSTYYYCSEALRDSFVNSSMRWTFDGSKRFIFVTIGLPNNIKGYDVVLKTAKLLKQRCHLDFEWLLVGPEKWHLDFVEHQLGVRCSEINVRPCGNLDEGEIVRLLLDSTCYIHLSYIDNSPNAVCEAQYLGLPVIATNVGGVSSLFPDDYDKSLLVPSNEPHITAQTIVELLKDTKRLVSAADSNYNCSHIRHNDDNIRIDLINAYKYIVDGSRK